MIVEVDVFLVVLLSCAIFAVINLAVGCVSTVCVKDKSSTDFVTVFEKDR